MNTVHQYLFFFISFVSVAFSSVRFEKGANINLKIKEGWVSYRCISLDGGFDQFRLRPCQMIESDKPLRQKIIVDKSLQGKKVKLKAIRSNGKQRTKVGRYDVVTGMTKKPWNLFQRGLFRRPLLGFGKNIVEYQVIGKNKEIISRGEFESTVKVVENIQCKRGNFTQSAVYCDDDDFTICREYFNDKNYCKKPKKK